MKLNNNDDSHNSGLNLLIYNMLLDIESHPAWVCGLKQYITITLIIRSYGCTKIPPLFFKGCCNGLHDSFGSRSIFSRLFFDYLNLNHYFCINT